MHPLKILLILIILSAVAYPQTLPDLPLAAGLGTVEVWNDTIYYFGGADNWAGTTLYQRIYKFNGDSWSLHDSIPDDMVWDAASAREGDDVYLLAGWPDGGPVFRKYNLHSGTWTTLPDSPNEQNWGITAEHADSSIFLLNSSGNVWEYDLADSSWTPRQSSGEQSFWDLTSVVYEGDIYVVGFDDSTFMKYNTTADNWTELAKLPYSVGACGMGVVDSLIYCIGGNSDGGPLASYNTVLVYDINADEWQTDERTLSGKRHWLAAAEYRGGLYAIGGIDSISVAVAAVEEIVPQQVSTAILSGSGMVSIAGGFYLAQNYPNPFNPSTVIPFRTDRNSRVRLTVYNIIGQKVRQVFDSMLPAGRYELKWDGRDDAGQKVSSGIYIYTLLSDKQRKTRKMILVR